MQSSTARSASFRPVWCFFCGKPGRQAGRQAGRHQTRLRRETAATARKMKIARPKGRGRPGETVEGGKLRSVGFVMGMIPDT